MFIAALFTIAKIWKQLKCPSTDVWKKMWYLLIPIYLSIYNKILYRHRKKGNPAICNSMDEPERYCA